MNRAGKRLGLVVAISAAVVLLISLTGKSRREPSVRGLLISEWMEIENKETDEYRSAVLEMDERCVRWLIHELDWSPTSVQTKVDGLMFRILRQPVTPEARPDYRTAAAFTLSMLGPRAGPAIPALRKSASVQATGLRDDGAQRTAIAALVLLGADSLDTWADKLLSPTNKNWKPYAFAAMVLRTNAAPIVPRLASTFEATEDDEIKERITMALRFIRSNPALSVRIFRASLTNSSSHARFHALVGLHNLGTESELAWNDLVTLLSDSNKSIRAIATNTLRRIDPEAAQQLGIK